jgi:hypothetical protein
LRAVVGRNRLIAPIGRARPIPLGSGASGGAKRRNKAIAHYDPHFASFNFTNALICLEASSAVLHVDYGGLTTGAAWRLETERTLLSYAPVK